MPSRFSPSVLESSKLVKACLLCTSFKASFLARSSNPKNYCPRLPFSSRHEKVVTGSIANEDFQDQLELVFTGTERPFNVTLECPIGDFLAV